MNVISVLILLMFSVTGCTMAFPETWYMINRNGVTEFKITGDSLFIRELSSDLKPKGSEKQAIACKGIFPIGDRILLICRDTRDTTKYSAVTIFDLRRKKSFKMAWNAIDTAVNDITTLIEIHKADKRPLLGYSLYNEDYMMVLKQMKDINEMSLNDFKKYYKIYMDKVQSQREGFQEYNFGYVAATHNFQLITQSLFETGFNPIQNASTVETLYRKYYEDIKNLEKAIPKK